MPKVKIIEKGCRGCELCVDICPVDVFNYDERNALAEVVETEDCIGCLSCAYACPTQCIDISDVELIRPFHRIEENVALVEQFLQTTTAVRTLTEQELDSAYCEVGILLSAFAEAITEILGRGHKSVGRRSGAVAAAHFPEMYEEKGLEDILTRMRTRFSGSFKFDYALTEEKTINLSIQPCGLLKAVRNAGEIPGESDLCLLFHEYWVGLISAFAGLEYSYEVLDTGAQCRMKLRPRNGR